MKKHDIMKANYFALPGLKGDVEFAGYKTKDMQQILNSVCEHFNVSEKVMRSKDRHRDVALCRQVAIFLMKRYTTMRLIDIAKFFNNDHTTIMHSIKKVGQRMETEPELREQIQNIEYLFIVSSDRQK